MSSGLARFLAESTQKPAGDTEGASFSPAIIVNVGDGRTVCWSGPLPGEDPTERMARWVTVHPPGDIEDPVSTVHLHTFSGCPVGQPVDEVNSETPGNYPFQFVVGGAEVRYVNDRYSPATLGGSGGNTISMKTGNGFVSYGNGSTVLTGQADVYIEAQNLPEPDGSRIHWITMDSPSERGAVSLYSFPDADNPRHLGLIATGMNDGPDPTVTIVDLPDVLLPDTWMRMQLLVNHDAVTLRLFDLTTGSAIPVYDSGVITVPGLSAAANFGYSGVSFGPYENLSDSHVWMDNLLSAIGDVTVTGVGTAPVTPVIPYVDFAPAKPAGCANILDLVEEYSAQIGYTVQVNTLWEITVMDPRDDLVADPDPVPDPDPDPVPDP